MNWCVFGKCTGRWLLLFIVVKLPLSRLFEEKGESRSLHSHFSFVTPTESESNQSINQSVFLLIYRHNHL